MSGKRLALVVTDDVRRAALDAADGLSVTRTRAIVNAVLAVVERDLRESCSLDGYVSVDAKGYWQALIETKAVNDGTDDSWRWKPAGYCIQAVDE